MIVLFVWFCIKGIAGENRFGAAPLAPAETPAASSQSGSGI